MDRASDFKSVFEGFLMGPFQESPHDFRTECLISVK